MRKDFEPILFIVALFIVAMTTAIVCSKYDKENPYTVGMHWNYRVECESGYLYKVVRGQGVFPIKDSLNNQLKCK